MMKRRVKKIVYRCMVWYHGDDGIVPSLAYGKWPERRTLTEAMNDKVVLYQDAMRANNPKSAFFGTVVEYPAGCEPTIVKREIYLDMGGDDP